MHRLQELVRLHRLGTGAREVARLLGMSPNTERDYRKALADAGLLDGDVEQLPELAALRAVIEAAKPEQPLEPHTSSVEKWRAETKRVRPAYVFVMVLAFSRHMFAKLVFDQTIETLQALHVPAFEFFGGVPAVLVPALNVMQGRYEAMVHSRQPQGRGDPCGLRRAKRADPQPQLPRPRAPLRLSDRPDAGLQPAKEG